MRNSELDVSRSSLIHSRTQSAGKWPLILRRESDLQRWLLIQLKENRNAEELKKEIKARRAKKASKSVYGQQNGENKVGGEKAGQSLDKGRMLKVSWETSSVVYGAAKLRGIFESFGIVEDVVIRSNSSKKKASALIVMTSREAVVRAAQNMNGERRTPLLVLPLEPIAPMFSDTTSTNQNESMGPGINNVVGAGFQDYEAFVMKKLQEANERKKCMDSMRDCN